MKIESSKQFLQLISSPGQIDTKFVFHKGMEKMYKDEILSISSDRDQFREMHKFVCSVSENFPQSWYNNPIIPKDSRFVAYLHDQTQKVITMLSGHIKPDGVMCILNTATRPEHQKKGYFKLLCLNLAEQLYENPELTDVNRVIGVIDLRISKEETEKLLNIGGSDENKNVALNNLIEKKINQQSNNQIEQNIKDMYGSVMGQTMTIMLQNPNTQPLANRIQKKIKSDANSQKIITVAKNILDAVKPDFQKHSISYGAKNLKFIPGINLKQSNDSKWVQEEKQKQESKIAQSLGFGESYA